ncbi:class C beta-lactamase-related serine hydrolase [Hwanghaeella grinnelliae]|uniref:Class C beta-lactamase-related serine hydrolase n=1 Tax=Hwanghaeella grinnelliae TaxID=2500179 RepID=A0A437QXV5_9PROT|nr:serine hydrolase [Hwanghaeella grinnelliae]RVU39348.1 class C beta-lactamase-related serine hydrolase [Hwanghaeella grinnelliae]
MFGTVRTRSAGIAYTLLALFCAFPTSTAVAAPAFQPRNVETFRATVNEAQSLGWRSEEIDAVIDYVTRMSTDSFIVSTGGKIVATVGDTHVPYEIHSMRKAMLSAVVGQHVGDGPRQIDLDASLEELGIDDVPIPLTALQKQATVLHLLRSMSGINHGAAASAGLTEDIDRRLGKEQNQPGTIWAYNNWDYNALTTVFETRTGLSVAEAFEKDVATPLGMSEFSSTSVHYLADPAVSRHRAAMFRMSASDLLAFGRMYLNNGKMGSQQVIPENWIANITGKAVETGIEGLRSGHGFLWWLPSPEDTGLPPGTYFAWGLGNQSLFVIPDWDTVIVHQSDTTAFVEKWMGMAEDGIPAEEALLKIALSCMNSSNASTDFCIEDRFTLRPEFDGLIATIVKAHK